MSVGGAGLAKSDQTLQIAGKLTVAPGLVVAEKTAGSLPIGDGQSVAVVASTMQS
jgi:hypothetical protein